MSRPVVLFTHDAGLLPEALQARGARALVVDPREIPWLVALSQRDAAEGSAAWLDVAGAHVDLDSASVWVGALDVAAHLPDTLPLPVRRAAVGESLAAWLGVLDALPGLVLDRPAATSRASNPLRADAALRSVGLAPPPVWLGVDPEGLEAFAATCPFGVEHLSGEGLTDPLVTRRVRAHPGPGARSRALVIGDTVLGAPHLLRDGLRQAAGALGVGQVWAELHQAPDGQWAVLGMAPCVPDPQVPNEARALAEALTRWPA